MDSDVVRDTVARLKGEGWHYERDLFAAVAPYLIGTVAETLQVLLIAGCIRSAGAAERKRYRWI